MKYNKMSLNALQSNLKRVSRELSKHVSLKKELDEDMLRDAVQIRFQIDMLTRSYIDVERKWCRQYVVHTFETDSVAFRGTEDECIEYMNRKENINAPLEMYWPMPNDKVFSWKEYFENVEKTSGYQVW